MNSIVVIVNNDEVYTLNGVKMADVPKYINITTAQLQLKQYECCFLIGW